MSETRQFDLEKDGVRYLPFDEFIDLNCRLIEVSPKKLFVIIPFNEMQAVYEAMIKYKINNPT